jgi:Mor family transcriptional regulator
MKLTANVRTVMVKQFINGATVAELARTWPFQPVAIEAVLRKRLKFHENNGQILDAELPLNNGGGGTK